MEILDGTWMSHNGDIFDLSVEEDSFITGSLSLKKKKNIKIPIFGVLQTKSDLVELSFYTCDEGTEQNNHSMIFSGQLEGKSHIHLRYMVYDSNQDKKEVERGNIQLEKATKEQVKLTSKVGR